MGSAIRKHVLHQHSSTGDVTVEKPSLNTTSCTKMAAFPHICIVEHILLVAGLGLATPSLMAIWHALAWQTKL